MPIIYCSAKLATFIGSSRLQPIEKRDFTKTHANFNAHLFYFAQRKCIMFTNKATLYTAVRLDVLKKDIGDLPLFFQNSLKDQLRADHLLDEDEFWNSFFTEPVFCKTDNDKRVIGSMNDYIYQLKVALAYGDLRFNPTDTNAGTNVNTTPMRMIKMLNSIVSLTRLKKEYNSSGK